MRTFSGEKKVLEFKQNTTQLSLLTEKKLLLGSVNVAVIDEQVDQMHLIYCQTFALFIRFKRTDYYTINKSKINIHFYLIKINDNNYSFMYSFFLDIDHEQVHTIVCLLGCFPGYK